MEIDSVDTGSIRHRNHCEGSELVMKREEEGGFIC